MLELSAEYVAGLFDGEGCFVITKSKNGSRVRRKEFYYTATAAIEIREEFIVDALIRKFGGSKTLKITQEGHSNIFRWKIGSRNLKTFCEAIGPHLLIKHEQSKIILRFMEVRAGRNTSPLTDNEIVKQEELREEMMELNKKGVSNNQHRQLIPDNACWNYSPNGDKE